jgi:hypothetical protein
MQRRAFTGPVWRGFLPLSVLPIACAVWAGCGSDAATASGDAVGDGASDNTSGGVGDGGSRKDGSSGSGGGGDARGPADAAADGEGTKDAAVYCADGGTKTLFDYFLPTPIVKGLTSNGWGASNVQPRDQDNGLEDRTMKQWSYWDGRIVKASDGKYHMFASRWDQAKGHWGGWPGSSCVHAVSESSALGPYVDKGLCYNDANGQGHNVMANQLSDGSYFILVSETRQPAPVYSSASLDGPWKALGAISVDASGFRADGTSSNTTFWPNPDGSILATSRNGIIMVSTSGLKGPFVVKTNSVYADIQYLPSGTPEDPCLWYSGGQYHMVYSYPLDRKMYHLVSKDGIHDWKNKGLAVDATKPFIKYTDGTPNVWNKLERPQVYLEDGHVKYFTFAAIDVDKGNDGGNDNHGSKIIVVPFDGARFDAETGLDCIAQ